jgi:tight adherence protein B
VSVGAAGWGGDVLFLGVAAAVFAVLVVLWRALTGGARRRLDKRARALRTRWEAPPLTAGPRLRLDDRKGRLDALATRVLPRPEHWRTQLARTGTGFTLGTFGLLAIAMAVALAATLSTIGITPLVAWPASLIFGYMVPRFIVGWMIRRRAARFAALFPEAIALMARGLRSGLPVTETLFAIGREIAGPVGQEFRRIGDQVQLGQPLDEVLWRAAERIDVTEFTYLVISLAIQRETGGNLTETLDNLDQLLRRRRQLDMKIRTFSAEARASAAIISALPFLMFAMLMVVNREFVMTLFTNSLGHTLLALATGSMLMGIVSLAKMSRFEI